MLWRVCGGHDPSLLPLAPSFIGPPARAINRPVALVSTHDPHELRHQSQQQSLWRAGRYHKTHCISRPFVCYNHSAGLVAPVWRGRYLIAPVFHRHPLEWDAVRAHRGQSAITTMPIGTPVAVGILGTLGNLAKAAICSNPANTVIYAIYQCGSSHTHTPSRRCAST